MSDEMTGPYQPPRPPPQPGTRFVPGELLAGRYRIVALLGKGGMGEVYRADDLKLGQSVALKFLPSHLAADPGRMARFHGEVRLARQVSHPNVCRVYDVAEHDGQPFLTMEHIDGQDLAALLRQVGRLPEERGIELARQLCLALGAVHDRGLLHRDLKPQNVMLDGRGQMRLTDFGLAAVAGEAADVHAGTPAYQAPEVLAGQEVTARSDLYALGLVLYELFTGRRAFEATDRGELARMQAEGTPSKPSSHVSGLNPAVERVILRCLQREPGARPRSAYEVVAGLPGGDPLAAALAAGETPSPKLVADGGEVGTIRPQVGAVLVGLVVAGLVLSAVLNDRTALLRRVPLPDPPEELARRARQLLAELGYPDRPADSASHFRIAADYLSYVNRNDPSPHRWDALGSGRPAAVHFFYREAPEPLEPGLIPNNPDGFSAPGFVTPDNPPPTRPRMASVRLDGQGRLLELIVLAKVDGGPTPARGDWWEPLLAAAGLPATAPADTAFRWLPPGPCDQRAAWDFTLPERPDVTFHAEAATFQGKPVFFRLGGDWTTSEDASSPSGAGHLWLLLQVAVMGGGAVLAVRNLRLGRGDRRGAVIIGGALVVGCVTAWLLGGHHPGTVGGEFLGLASALGIGGLGGLIAAPAYLGLEPAVRRRWPWRMTAWTRVLAGRLRDPLVGRDLLIGIMGGIMVLLLNQATHVVPDWLGLPAPQPLPISPGAGPLVPRVFLLVLVFEAAFWALILFALAFLLALVLRRERLAWAAFVAVPTILATLQFGSMSLVGTILFVLFVAMTGGVQVWMIARFGLLALTAAYVTAIWLLRVPLTWDASAWYFGQGLLGAGLVIALALCGFVTATGGRRLFQGGFFGDE
jgi:Protein kinase domain